MLSVRPAPRCLLAAAILSLTLSVPAAAQAANPLAAAQTLDQELRRIKTIPPQARSRFVADISKRILALPPQYSTPLALNLVIDGVAGSNKDTLQLIGDTVSQAMKTAPENFLQNGYRSLAELVRFSGITVKIDHPGYLDAVRQLDQEAAVRQNADFTLPDLQGRQWNRKALQGKVVLVNFWATWCPPCREELPDLETVYRRFAAQGLVVLAISDEDTASIRNFLAERPVTFPVLLDPDQVARKAFLATSLPVSFLYSRDGRLAAQTYARPSMEELLEMLARAGIR
ncbi:MAG: TlpA family protein disulfide reductase [Acidobacteria bacterium]|nr:TlpA family protein disulfide reductase [Acidobacteriota bacterium]